MPTPKGTNSIGADIKNVFHGIWHFFTKGKYSFLIAAVGFFCVLSVIFYEFSNLEHYVENLGWLGVILLIIFPFAKIFDMLTESGTDPEGSVSQYLKKHYGIKPDTYTNNKDEVKLAFANSILEGRIGGKDRPTVKDVKDALIEIEKL